MGSEMCIRDSRYPHAPVLYLEILVHKSHNQPYHAELNSQVKSVLPQVHHRAAVAARLHPPATAAHGGVGRKLLIEAEVSICNNSFFSTFKEVNPFLLR